MKTLIELFFNKTGEYNKNLKFQVFIITILIISFFRFYFENNYVDVIVITVFIFAILNYYIEEKKDSLNDINNILLLQLNTLKEMVKKSVDEEIKSIQKYNKISNKEKQKMYNKLKLEYLYLDADLITFLYNNKDILEVNKKLYFTMMNGINNILKLKYEIEYYYEETNEYPQNTSEMLENVLVLHKNVINNMHNYIHTVHKTSNVINVINKSIKRLDILLQKNINKIYEYYILNIKKRGIHSRTKFVNYNGIKYYEPSRFNNLYTDFYY